MRVNHELFQRALLTVLTLGLLAGCAVSPQQIAIDPQAEAEFPAASRSGIDVNLSVRDERGTEVLGSLGGTYPESSTLSLSNDLASDLHAELSEKLQNAGYNVTSNGGDFQMVVSINQLNYEWVSGSVSSEVRVVADIGMRIEDDGGFRESTFRTPKNQIRVTRPTAEDNRMFLEEALNASLSRLVQDPRLHQFLRR